MSATIIPFDQGQGLREPPNNVEAEQALLGAILLAPGALAAVSGWLAPEYFYLPVHGRIFAAALALAERGGMVNAVTLAHHFREDDDLSEVGGPGYLATLAGSAVTVINAPHYGRTILDLAARREMIQVGGDLADQAHAAGPVDDPLAITTRTIAALDAVSDMLASSERRGTSLASAMGRSLERTLEAHRKGGGVTGVPTGLRDVDDLLAGLHGGEMTVLAARPGQGKTAMALTIALAAARAGHDVAFFTLEMPPEQLGQRILAATTGIGSDRQRHGRIDGPEYEALDRARAEFEALPLDLIDCAGWTVQRIGAHARRVHRRRKLGLVVVDYLQLVAPSDAAARRNRVDEVTEISAGLKRLARELGAPVLALAQLNRGLEGRENKRPRLADLRDSGAIEQDADVIAFIHREVEYLRRERPKGAAAAAVEAEIAFMADQAELLIEKHRQGPTGQIRLRYDAARTAFRDWD